MARADPPARVLLAPTGTLGDVYPFIAVAIALREAGHRPTIATMAQYRAVIEAEGIDFRPVRPGRAELIADGFDEPSLARAVALDQRAGLVMVTPHLAATVADLSAAMADCDVVVGGSLSLAARILAEAAGLPVATLLLQPMGWLSAVDPPVMAEAPWLPAIGRRCGASAVEALYKVASIRGRAGLRPFAQLRQRLGLPRVRDEIRDNPRRGALTLAMYPPAFAGLPADAPPNAAGSGFPFYPAAGGETLAPDLARFLANGPAPLVFTLGSFVTHAAGDFYAAAAVAAHALGRRAVLLVGDHAVARHRPLAAADRMVLGSAPHAALFPHAAAVIHHGGIGTAAQALRAGRAQLVCPFFGDQFDNAERLRRLGVATTLPLRRFTAARGMAALDDLLASPDKRRRAAELGPAMSGEDGPALAATRIAMLARQPLPILASA